MYKAHSLLALLLIILILALPVMAEEGTPTPEAPEAANPPVLEELPVDSPSPSWLSEVAFASVFVTVAVSLLKLVPFEPLRKIPSQRLALFLNLALLVGYRLVIDFGGDADLFVSYVTNAGQLGESFLQFLVTFWSAEALYTGAKAVNMPVLGAEKPAPKPIGKDL